MIYVSSGIQGSQFLTKKLLICKSFPGICLLLSPSFWPGRCRCWRLRYGTRRRAGRTKPENIFWCIFLIFLYRKKREIVVIWNLTYKTLLTLRHLNTCADPSLMPGEILEVSEENREIPPEVCGKPLLGTSATKTGKCGSFSQVGFLWFIWHTGP